MIKAHVALPTLDQNQLVARILIQLGLRASQYLPTVPLAQLTSDLLDSDFIVIGTQGKDFKCLLLAGYAYAIGLPILYYCPGLTGNFNLMLSGSAACVATTEAELESHLKALAKDLNYTCPYLGTVE